MKKILSLVLVLSLVLGTFSFAFADGHLPEDIIGEDSEEAVATLMALGVVDGYEDGTYKPEKTVTRAEMAKLLVEALGYGELAEGATATFSDAQGHWAESYVGFAASMDLVLGYPDGTFKPDAVMSMDEAMTMVIRALGYTDEVLKGTWPTNYKVKALDLELTDGLSSLSGPGLRGNVAILLFNALDARLVEVIKDANGLYSYDYIEIDSTTDKKLIDQIGDKVDNEKIDYVDVFGEDALPTAINLEEYLFHTIDYYENADGEVAYVANVDTDELKGTVTTAGAMIYVTDADYDVYEVDNADNAPLFYNGEEATSTTTDTLTDAAVTVVYDGDDVETVTPEGIIAWQYDLWQATNTYSVRRPLQLDRGTLASASYKLPAMLDADDDAVLDEAELTIEGDVETLEDIEEDDLVYYYASDTETIDSNAHPKKVKLLVVRDTFEGKYTKKVDSDTWVFGGETFDKSSDAVTNWTDSPTFGDDFKLVLDKDGDVYDIIAVSEAASDTKYGLFVDTKDGTLDEVANEYSVDAEPQVWLITDGGDLVKYDVDTSGLDLSNLATEGTTTASIDGLTLTATTAEAIEVSTVSGINLGTLVSFTLDSDGFVDSITKAAIDGTGNYEYDSDSNEYDGSFFLTDNTVIFDKTGSSWTDWTVDDEGLLGTTGTATYVLDEYNLDVVVVTATNGVSSAEDTYAIITDYAQVYDADQDAEVQEVTAFVNGVEVTYNTDDASLVDDADISSVSALTIEDGLLTGVTYKPDEATFTTVSAIEGMRLRNAGDDKLYTVADDAIVYVLDADGVTVGDYSEILVEDKVDLYDTNDDGEYQIVVLDLR
jgi:hypothetical protein